MYRIIVEKPMKRIISATIVAFLMIGFTANAQTTWDGSSAQSWTKGAGTKADPFQIETASHLAYLATSTKGGTSYQGKYFKMMNNLDLCEKQWIPIGIDNNKAFKGNFDGNGKTITNLHIESTSLQYEYAGLFGYIENGVIANLGIVGESSIIFYSYIFDYSSTGGIVGQSSNSVIFNCYNSCSVYPVIVHSSGKSTAGGIVGSSFDSLIVNCYNTGEIATSSYYSYAGGIVGYSDSSVISNCYNVGLIFMIMDSYFTFIAGIVGHSVGSESYINNCYNTGIIIVDSPNSTFTGGITGLCFSISNCYTLANMVTINGVTGNGNKYGTVKTSAEMKNGNFVTLLNHENEIPAWLMDLTPNINNGYPILKK